MSKIVLVTGASSGIGKATAKSLIGKGYKVYVAARRLSKMDDLKELGAIPVQMDITKDEEVQAVVNQIETENDGVDILINNAGFAIYGAMEDTTIDDARYQFEVNLFGLARLTQLVLPKMREKRSGKIINISSVGGKIYTPLGSWYHATKHALEGWSDCLRLELAPFNIQVVVVQPGMVKTEFGNVMGKQLVKYYDKSAYQTQMDPYIKLLNDPKRFEAMGTDASVLGNVFVKAVNARNPRRRYVKGAMAKPMMFARKWFGDGFFERMLRMSFS